MYLQKPGEITFNKFINLNFYNINNYLKLLPDDVLIHIFNFYEDIACNKIIDKWYYYLNKKLILGLSLHQLKYLTTKPNGEYITKIHCLEPTLPVILINCLSLLSGKEDSWWLRQFIYIINSLILVTTTETNLWDYKKQYLDIEHLIAKLLVKFDLFNDYCKALDNYNILYDIDEDTFQYFNKNRHHGNINVEIFINKDELFKYDHFIEEE